MVAHHRLSRERLALPEAVSIRLTAVFSGRVQGVGFRYTACRIAADYRVTGFVRNLPDGRVELVAEGPAEQARPFVQSVRSQMAAYVRQADVRQSTATGQFDRFGITYA
jgi:acylphosphatase